MKILMYLQSYDGHRIIYASVLIDWALDNSYEIIVSSPDTRVNELNQKCVQAIVSSDNNHLNNVISLEKKYQPDISILANADYYIRNKEEQLVYSGAPNRIIIANYTLWAHDMEKPINHNNTLMGTLKNIRKLLKSTIHRKMEKYYYCKKLPSMQIANVISSMDEYYVEKAKNIKVVYIPDIYTIHGVYENNQVQKNLVNLYSEYIKRLHDSEVILYLGQWQERRGLLQLLKLTALKPNRVFVCVGDRMDGVQYSEEIEVIYKKLNDAGRVFMTQTKYLNNGVFMDYVFDSVSIIVLPYKNYHGGSGSLITSTSYGKPALVPNYGHMRKTVKRYQIGACYTAGDLTSMENEYIKLIDSKEDYKNHCIKYAELFSREKVYNSLDRVVAKCLE